MLDRGVQLPRRDYTAICERDQGLNEEGSLREQKMRRKQPLCGS